MSDDVVADHAAEVGELDALLSTLDHGQWAAASSRCPGWTVADIVLHLAQTDELAVASLDGTFDDVARSLAAGASGSTVDELVGAMVDRQRGAPSGELHRRWRNASGQLVAELANGDLHRRVPWVAGELAGLTLAATRLSETWIHAGDIAVAAGGTVRATDRLRHIARLAWRTVPYAFARAGRELRGPVAFELTGPDDEAWTFDEGDAVTVVRGPALDACLVAGRRVDAGKTDLDADGPDGPAVLELMRTFA